METFTFTVEFLPATVTVRQEGSSFYYTCKNPETGESYDDKEEHKVMNYFWKEIWNKKS